MPEQAFPATRKTWIGEMLVLGETGRNNINQHVMEIYTRPLEIYFRGSSYRSLGEPTEVVHGFLADRLSSPDYFTKWEQSGFALRRWLMNGLLMYLKEIYQRARRDASAHQISPFIVDPHPTPESVLEKAFHQEYVTSIVRRAMDQAESYCLTHDLDLHWMSFVLHHVEQLEFARVAETIGTTARKAKEMARTPRTQFRAALQETLLRDGIPRSRLREEIQYLVTLGDS